MLLRHCLLRGGLRLVQNRLQGPESAVAHDPAEVLLRSQEGRGHPAPRHRAIVTAGDAAGWDAHSGARALDEIGRRQAALQRGRRT
jgi:hypothetical protein